MTKLDILIVLSLSSQFISTGLMGYSIGCFLDVKKDKRWLKPGLRCLVISLILNIISFTGFLLVGTIN